jgi:hypothetical protein
VANIVKNNSTGNVYGNFPSLADAQAHEARLTKRWKRAASNPEPSPFAAQTV